MKASLEHLSHFSCSHCSKWWSIGDFPWGERTHLWHLWCGTKQELPEQPIVGSDLQPEISVVVSELPRWEPTVVFSEKES